MFYGLKDLFRPMTLLIITVTMINMLISGLATEITEETSVGWISFGFLIPINIERF